eukprot:gnl/Chilomastix_cuspidata/3595.p1 GENE.gnl/Chilomastix_cuspidata/3595~~gnl/Chilomastix_cuspidata/3595.p1  ORF type:complete len:787 (+),score=161.12 gnl/Chilomastix_cuspidata/3595:298-2361(+)
MLNCFVPQLDVSKYRITLIPITGTAKPNVYIMCCQALRGDAILYFTNFSRTSSYRLRDDKAVMFKREEVLDRFQFGRVSEATDKLLVSQLVLANFGEGRQDLALHGREALIRDALTFFHDVTVPTRVLLLHGLPKSGKTSLAKLLVSELAHNYPAFRTPQLLTPAVTPRCEKLLNIHEDLKGVNTKNVSADEAIMRIIRNYFDLEKAAPRAARSPPLSVVEERSESGGTALSYMYASPTSECIPLLGDFPAYTGVSRMGSASPSPSLEEELGISFEELISSVTASMAEPESDIVNYYHNCFFGCEALMWLENAGDAAVLSQLIPSGHSCCIVVTSRKRLKLNTSVLGPAVAFKALLVAPLSIEDGARFAQSLEPSLSDADAAAIARFCGGFPELISLNSHSYAQSGLTFDAYAKKEKSTHPEHALERALSSLSELHRIGLAVLSAFPANFEAQDATKLLEEFFRRWLATPIPLFTHMATPTPPAYVNAMSVITDLIVHSLLAAAPNAGRFSITDSVREYFCSSLTSAAKALIDDCFLEFLTRLIQILSTTFLEAKHLMALSAIKQRKQGPFILPPEAAGHMPSELWPDMHNGPDITPLEAYSLILRRVDCEVAGFTLCVQRAAAIVEAAGEHLNAAVSQRLLDFVVPLRTFNSRLPPSVKEQLLSLFKALHASSMSTDPEGEGEESL